jgi:hypothetical protein
MRWTEVREQYPNQWLIIDALEAHTEGNRRKLEQMTVVEMCSDGAAAYQRYRELHRQYPMRGTGHPRKALARITEELCS